MTARAPVDTTRTATTMNGSVLETIDELIKQDRSVGRGRGRFRV